MSWITLCLAVFTLQSAPADLVIDNARIWSDGRVGFAEFAAVRDGRFVYVGAYKAEFIGPETEVVDAAGRVVIPGLIDSHIHMLGGGTQLMRLHLRDVVDRDAFIDSVAEQAADLPDGGAAAVEAVMRRGCVHVHGANSYGVRNALARAAGVPTEGPVLLMPSGAAILAPSAAVAAHALGASRFLRWRLMSTDLIYCGPLLKSCRRICVSFL